MSGATCEKCGHESAHHGYDCIYSTAAGLLCPDCMYDAIEQQAAGLERLRDERDKLQRFKDWVHTYLDTKGIPTDPGGPHSDEGCRIGDRMDFVFAELERLRGRLAEIETEIESEYASPAHVPVVNSVIVSSEFMRRIFQLAKGEETG